MFRAVMAMGMGALVLCAPVRADNASAKVKLDRALTIYEGRSDLAKVDQALALLTEAVAEADEADLKYDLLVFSARALYYKGTHTAGDANKITLHDQGYKKAKEARAVNDDYADALYWAAANLSRWGEANGVVASLGKKKEVLETLEGIAERKARDGRDGETYEGYGADRIQGRLYFKLPAFAGGSQEKALKHLERTYTNARDLALNVIWYAEALYSGDAAGKAQAKRILDELLAKDPNTLNPNRVPETIEEFRDARILRQQMGN